jgi:hypothetical protein
MTNIGPAVVWQNATTGDLMYSIDTGSGPGAGGYTAWQKLPITTPARNNTLLGATGFTGGDGDVYVSLLPTCALRFADSFRPSHMSTTSQLEATSAKAISTVIRTQAAP